MNRELLQEAEEKDILAGGEGQESGLLAANDLQGVYPRQTVSLRALQLLGFKQWLRLFLATVLSWHLTFSASALATIVFLDKVYGNDSFQGNLISPAIILLTGGLLFPEGWAGVLVILIISMTAARMKQSFRLIFSILIAAGTGLALVSASATHSHSLFYSETFVFGGLISAFVSALVFFSFAKRQEVSQDSSLPAKRQEKEGLQ